MDLKHSDRDSSVGTRALIFAAGGIIVLAALAAYHHSFSGPFVFDDFQAIKNNAKIRQLWPLWDALSPPPGGLPTSERPIANLSFALSYALGGLDVWGYHVANLLIHVLSGLTLFGVVRRTLEKVGTGGPPVRSGPQGDTEGTDGRPARPYLPIVLAFATALLWTVHPLQTESVTYLSQRVEALMGLFYLLTLYCFIRYADGTSSFAKASAFAQATADKSEDEGAGRSGWAWLSVGACLLGMATKEVVVSAPVLVLLYDRTFVAGSFAAAWQRRRRYYLALAATWLLLLWLMMREHGARGNSAGFGLGIAVWPYVLTQCWAIVHYLKLSFWPSPLVLDYGTRLIRDPLAVAPQALALLLLLAGSIAALLRPSKPGSSRSALGFAGVWFFAILAPSSSFIPLGGQPVAEHRMYLPLAAVIAVAVCGGYALLERVLREVGTGGPPVRPLRISLGSAADGRAARPYLAIVLALAIALGCLTAQRNQVYRSELALWTQAADQWPASERAQYNAGIILAAAGRWPEAIARYEKTLQLEPGSEKTRYCLSVALMHAGHPSEAIARFAQFVQQHPDAPALHRDLGDALADADRNEEAATQYAAALRLEPDDVKTHGSLGAVFLQLGRNEQAVEQFAAASRLQPDNAEIHNILGAALAQLGRTAEARAQFSEALRLRPDDTEARASLDQLPALPQDSR